MEKKYLLVALVVVLAAALFTFTPNDGNFLGATVGEFSVDEYQDGCVDNDPDNLYGVAGEAINGRIRYVDHCQGNDLHQYACTTSNTIRKTHAYRCPGSCVAGACV